MARIRKTPDYGVVMHIYEWIKLVWSGGIIDYDGTGEYAGVGYVTDINVYPSDYPNINRGYQFIIWYNK